jgi:proteic killer suppression protein
MIKNFKCSETEKIFLMKTSKKLPADIQRRARMKLVMLDSALLLEDLLRPPSNYLEKLSGDRKGQLNIRINSQWRICFIWEAGNAYQVEIVDYH